MEDSPHKQAMVITGCIAACLGLASKLLYRPWVLERQIPDYGFAGSAPSFFYVVGACLLLAGVSRKPPYRNMVYAAAGAAVYELEQYYTSMVFDGRDLLATGLGLGVALLLGKGLRQKREEES